MRRQWGGFPILQSSFTLAKEGGVTDKGEGWGVSLMGRSGGGHS